jgi:hypothetical protein
VKRAALALDSYVGYLVRDGGLSNLEQEMLESLAFDMSMACTDTKTSRHTIPIEM